VVFTAITYGNEYLHTHYLGGKLVSVIFTETATAAAGGETYYHCPSPGTVYMISKIMQKKKFRIRSCIVSGGTTGIVKMAALWYRGGASNDYVSWSPSMLLGAGSWVDAFAIPDVLLSFDSQYPYSIFYIGTSALTVLDAFQTTIVLEVVE
jgi:hypothetical protein